MSQTKPSKPYDFKVDRTTPLGNSFTMITPSNRDEVCDKYDEYFNNTMRYDAKVREYMNDMWKAYVKYKKLRLFCWCTPNRCHAESIKGYFDKYFNNGS